MDDQLRHQNQQVYLRVLELTGLKNAPALASKLKVGRTTAYDWESGKTPIPQKRLAALAVEYGITVDWFFRSEARTPTIILTEEEQKVAQTEETTREPISQLEASLYEAVSTIAKESGQTVDSKLNEMLLMAAISVCIQKGDGQSLSTARDLTWRLFEIISKRLSLASPSHQIKKKRLKE